MKQIEKILREKYGVGIFVAPAEAILWATDQISDTETAKNELRKANNYRNKYGRVTLIPPYGHRLF